MKELELDSVSHVIEDIEDPDEKGIAHAILKILPTTKGKNLATIIRNGGSVGVSARGMGEVDKDGMVKNYSIAGIDFTLNPSFPFRVGQQAVFESKTETDENDGSVTLEQLKEWGLIEDTKPLTEEDLHIRHLAAIQAGYKGSFEDYRKLYEKEKR